MSFDEGWDRLTLKSAGVVLIDCDHRTPSAAESGYPYIAIPQLKDGHIALDGARLISESDYSDWTKKLSPQGHDVIVVRRCNSGESGHVPEGLQCAIGQNLVVLRADGTRVLPQYLRWLVRGTEWWDEVGKYINVGAVFDSLRCRDIPNFSLPIPPLDEQREIATVLAALDDRITLLREINATLEGIAQALFKSWFVDFDPVRAKVEGREPEGMDEATAGLFPDAFEESELGLVPKGWAVGTLSDLLRLHKGTVNPGLQPATLFQHFSLPAFDNGQSPVVELGSAIKSNKTTVPIDGVLLSKLNPHIPRIWLPTIVAENAVCSTEFLPFVPTRHATTAFVYCLLSAPNFSSVLCQLVTGTSNSHQRIRPEGVLSMPSVLPPTKLIFEFDCISCGLLDRLKANRGQIQTLTALRDTLLPRLISGQLRIPEALEELETA